MHPNASVPLESGVVPGAGRMWGCLLEVIGLGREWEVMVNKQCAMIV